MPLKLYSPELKLNIKTAELVEEDSLGVKFYADQEEKVLLYTEGLNPCLGLVLCGTVTYGNNENSHKRQLASERDHFVAIAHLVGPDETSHDADGIKFYCEEALTKLVSSIEDDSELSITEVNLKSAYLLHCEQADTQNIQNAVATAFANILQSPDEVKRIVEDEGALGCNFEMDDDYQFEHFAEKEKTQTGENDALHVFVRVQAGGEPEVIYHKGFETVARLLGSPKSTAVTKLGIFAKTDNSPKDEPAPKRVHREAEADTAAKPR